MTSQPAMRFVAEAALEQAKAQEVNAHNDLLIQK